MLVYCIVVGVSPCEAIACNTCKRLCCSLFYLIFLFSVMDHLPAFAIKLDEGTCCYVKEKLLSTLVDIFVIRKDYLR